MMAVEALLPEEIQVGAARVRVQRPPKKSCKVCEGDGFTAHSGPFNGFEVCGCVGAFEVVGYSKRIAKPV